MRAVVPARSRLRRPASRSRAALARVQPASLSVLERETLDASAMERFLGSKEKVSLRERRPSALVMLMGIPLPPARSIV